MVAGFSACDCRDQACDPFLFLKDMLSLRWPKCSSRTIPLQHFFLTSERASRSDEPFPGS